MRISTHCLDRSLLPKSLIDPSNNTFIPPLVGRKRFFSMPLSINVGLSRKASKDYQSTGYSINVTAELDQALLTRPDELQAQIDALYGQAQNAIDRQLRDHPAASAPRSPTTNGNGYHRESTGGHRTNGSRNGGGMTVSQRKAIDAIARRSGVDAQRESHEVFGVALDDLSLRQASELIDTLKGQSAPAVRRN